MGYDPAAIAAYYGRRPLQVVGRLVAICFPLLGFYLQLWLDQRLGRRDQEHQRAVQLRQLLTNLGPAYIKIGQALSTRPDLVPPPLPGGAHPSSGPVAPLPQRHCLSLY
jgi:predicted unusual protein kinase regulating ubiquinone biosynthesis (AarF/ABC1/UbiB family)